ncbi:hypothetical protein [Candidatus Nitrosotenuis uzonensis]|uniref:Uncharacterized protein n=1 Tax=Candidatus Nitrosotenuis uzonensis TaxID=1407055 RepID=A0A812F406_9ARCH|nr:hypothetical protein [Candidatus Nitrosotenuis uzonensis]CAE6501621.1 conserved exported hypothetical protein [Candidatus Nitrosotenuis uzonensis]
MRRIGLAAFALVVLVPAIAHGQTSQITLLDTFGEFKRDEQIFVFGQVSQISPDLFIVVQILNPRGDLCQVQQLKPLSDGHFITEPGTLSGSICGIPGEYAVRVFYGDFTASSKFVLKSERVKASTDVEYISAATSLLESKINSLDSESTAEFANRLDQIRAISASSTAIIQMRDLYTDVLLSDFEESDTFGLNPTLRPAIDASLEIVDKMVTSSVLDQSGAKKIKEQVYAAMFYAHIGNNREALSTISDIYVQITNATPQKVPSEQPPTYEEINQTLLNMMTKSNSIMNRQLKEEIGFIFARGTGPLYIEELRDLLDMLTKARTLDTTLRQDDVLTLTIRTEWSTLRESLLTKETLSDFLEQKDRVDTLFDATVLLRNLDRVDRFITRDPQPELAEVIKPRLDELMLNLRTASSPEQIVLLKKDILDMKNVIDISARISTTIEFSRANNADPKLISSFETMLEQVRAATTVGEILKVVADFDGAINELREKRSPLSVLKFDYEKLRTKAELQADYESLVTINNALKAINTAIELEKGSPTVSKIDKIEVLLAWASQQEPIIEAKLASYSKDAYKIRASDILQRAQSLENLANLGIIHNRFLPGYVDYVNSLKDKLSTARNLVIKGDLDGADIIVRESFAEWQQVSQKYSEDPFGSEVGYSADEIRKIEYRKKIGDLSDFATQFYNADFAENANEFNKLKEKAYELVEYGNFVDADSKINEIRNFLADKLEMKNKKIIFDISYNPEKQIWVMSGAVDKQIMDRRENLYLTVYDMKGSKYSTLKFSDTKHGEIFTQWYAPSEPGMYVVLLEYQAYQASQIVDVPDKTRPVFSSTDLKTVDYAREYEELKSFIDTFGGNNYQANKATFDSTMKQIETALAKKDFSTSKSKMTELQSMIERYLPSRSRTAVIDVTIQDDKLYISGAIQKTLAFSEDIFIDIFNQKGERVDEIPLKDSASGSFNQVINKKYPRGTYVVQLQYHDLVVSDFFRVN